MLLTPLSSVSAERSQASPRLEADPEVATAGYYQLRWHASGVGAGSYELEEEAAGQTPKTVYRGADLGASMTGRTDGVYRYRVRIVGDDGSHSSWSNTVAVTVAHHPLSRALVFFGAGALVFLATVALIVIGARREADR